MLLNFDNLTNNSLVPKCLIIVLSLIIISQTYTFYSNYKFIKENQAVKVKTLQKQKTTNFSALNTDFFGKYLPIELQNNKIKESLLNLQIVGIIFSRIKEESEVIIKMDDGKDKAFRIGELLPSGVEINQIMPDSIVVKRNGVLESLSFLKPDA